jgi:uncharacterized protein (TIGR02597 family)
MLPQKSNTPLNIVAALILAGSFLAREAGAQTTATTPVGFIKLTLPAAADASTPSSTTISIPLYDSPDFSGPVASVDSSSSVSVSGAAWTAGQFTSSPHLIRFKSGAQSGRFYLITSNTTSQVTVDTQGGSLASVAANDTCEVLPARTLGSLFGTGTTSLQTGSTPNSADNVFLWNGSSWATYYHNGSSWRKSGSLASQDATIIYPDDGLFVIHRALSAVDLIFTGTVPSTQEQTDLAGSGLTFMGNRFPLDTQLSTVGLQQTAAWVTGTTSNGADNVFIWNGSSWSVYYHNGTNWKKSGSLSSQDATVIPSGSAIFVKRAASSSATLTQSLPYTP